MGVVAVVLATLNDHQRELSSLLYSMVNVLAGNKESATLVQWSRGGAKLPAPALISCLAAQMALHVLSAKPDHLNHAGFTLCSFNQRGLLT